MTIKFLKVKCGDAILINFKDDKNIPRNILIDTGRHYKTIFPHFYRKLKKVFEKKEKIDLLILTHRDDDHIGGFHKLLTLKDFDLEQNIGQVWLNHSLEFPATNSKTSLRKAVDIKEYLQEKGMCPKVPITTQSGTIDVFGVKLTILSPDKKRYEKELGNFKKEENTRIGRKPSDHKKTIEVLEKQMRNFKENDKDANGSSIAFLLEYKTKKALFLADAFPSVIMASLEQLLKIGNEEKIDVDFVKVSHHGSKENTSLELLSIIETEKFIISSDGYNSHKLPDKETLVRIIRNPKRTKDKPIEILFSEKDNILEKIFEVDNNPFEKWKFSVKFPKDDEVLTINWNDR